MHRIGSILLAASILAAAAACSSEGGGTEPGAIALALGSSSATVVQGGSTQVTATLTRSGGFTGTVDLTVAGAPAGVTGAVSNISTVGGTTTATVTVSVTAATLPGTYDLTVRGTGTGVSAASAPFALTVSAAPDYALSLAPASASVVQGASTTPIAVTIARTNFTDAVTLALGGTVPAGVTAVFTPPAPTATTSSLVISATGSTPAGSYNLTVNGTGTPGPRSTPLTLTVTAAGSFTLAVTPAGGVTMVQGTVDASKTINITRVNYAAGITLTAEGLPNGVSASFAGNPVAGSSSLLTLTATGTATVGGPVTVTIRGTGPAALRRPGDLASVEATTTLALTVTPPSNNVTVSFVGCSATSKAVWFAFMDGTSGTWTAVTGVGDQYQFNITQGRGSFAYVQLGTGFSSIQVQHKTQAELTTGVIQECVPTTTPPVEKIVNGTVTALPASWQARVSFGHDSRVVNANGAFQLNEALEGSFDLIGYASPASAGAGNRVFAKRAENPPAGGSFSVDVDFFNTLRSRTVATGSATMTGLTGTETQVFHNMTLRTGGTACHGASLYGVTVVGASFFLYGFPSDLMIGGDMHDLLISANNGSGSSRTLEEFFPNIATRAASPFVLPTQLPAPAITNAGGPYKRISMTVNAVPAEYDGTHTMGYGDLTTVGRSGNVKATQGWVGGSTLNLVLPNFAGVGIFNNDWAPKTTDQLIWTLTSSGGTLTNGCAAGQRRVDGSRSGTF